MKSKLVLLLTHVRRCDVFGFPALFAGVVAAFVFTLSARSMADQDIGWHLRNAQYLLQQGHFIHRDMFTYTTPGATWIDHEWLAEIPFFLAWRALGDRGIYSVVLVLLEAIFLGIYVLSYRYSRDERAACIAAICSALLATVSFGPRTLLFGWLLLVIELLIIQHAMKSKALSASAQGAGERKSLWLLPPLFLVWVNMHGSWLIGILLLSAFTLFCSVRLNHDRVQNIAWRGRELRHLVAILLACVAVLFVNPYSWHLVAYPFDLAFRQKLNIASVEEWRSLDFRSLRARILFLTCGISLVRQLVRRRVWSPFELALVGIGLYAAMSYTRFLFLAAILVMPLLAPDFTPGRRQDRSEGSSLRNATIWAALILWCCFFYHSRWKPAQQAAEGGMSRDVLSRLSSLPPTARILNDYDWGGFLEWNLPSRPVFIDSRVDIFERAGVLSDYLDIVELRDSLALLDKYRIDCVVFQKDTPLVYLLRQTPSWRVEYEDKTAVLFGRVVNR